MALTSLVEVPLLKPTCSITWDTDVITINNGTLGVLVEADGGIDGSVMSLLSDQSPGAFEVGLTRLVGGDRDVAAEITTSLVKSGVIIENPATNPSDFRAEYIGYRLIDVFRSRAPDLWSKNELFRLLRMRGNFNVAAGFLLESYFHIRSASWTAAPVLGHSLTKNQRDILESFWVIERSHGEEIAEQFALIGLSPDAVRACLPAPETELFERFLFSCGHRSVAEFAAALILPEVEEIPAGAVALAAIESSESLISTYQDLPVALVKAFEEHEKENESLEHADLPVQLMHGMGSFSREQATTLFETLHYAIHAYDILLGGVVRRYKDWDGNHIPVLTPAMNL